ncbi:hypothetical protein C7U89_01490 [Bradyrhizobium sp. WBOS4]|nr:hypothetical protein [Bradyrhizobium sp. WBOS8]MDD1581629.1 hypothetical protein [Bradyrhizobium sp. WBOS4]
MPFMAVTAHADRRTLTTMNTRKPKPTKNAAGFVLGRKAWAKISAVEGIVLSKESEERLAEFDRLGLSPAERRERIIKKYTCK